MKTANLLQNAAKKEPRFDHADPILNCSWIRNPRIPSGFRSVSEAWCLSHRNPKLEDYIDGILGKMHLNEIFEDIHVFVTKYIVLIDIIIENKIN